MEQTDVNIALLCRLCGSKTQSGDRVEIFTSDDLSHQIRSLLALDLSESDLLPTFVCAQCAAKLADFNEFKALSHRTDLMLRDLLGNARDASCVDCPGLSDNVAMDNVLTDSLTTDEFKFEDEPEIDMTNCNSDKFEQDRESDPLSFELDSISESTSRVLPNNSNTDNLVQNTKYTLEPLFYDGQTRDLISPPHPKIQANVSRDTVQYLTLKDRLHGLHTEDQAAISCNITKDQYPRTNRAAQLCKNYTTVQVQSPSTMSAVLTCNADSAVQVQNPHATPAVQPNNNNNNKDYDHICQHCNKGFMSKSKMQIHIRSAHTKQLPFECNKCGQKFRQQHMLRSHIETYHNKSKNYYCKICCKSFKLAKYFRRHAGRVHLGVDVPIAFSCELCGEIFIEKTNLLKHISTMHQEVKEPEETNYSCLLVQRNHNVAPHTSIVAQAVRVGPTPSVNNTKGSQKNTNVAYSTSIEDNTSQPASVEALPSVKNNQISREDPQTLKIQDNFLDTFKGKIVNGETSSNPRNLKDCGTKKLKPTESSKNTEITHRTGIVSDQNSSENSKKSKENDTESTKQLENSDSKAKRDIQNIIYCPFCHIIFRHFNDLNCHIKKAHTLNCTYCFKSFRCDLDLQDHVKAKHTNVVVNKTFLIPGQLQEHNAKELSEKQDFQCKLCPKKFNALRYLNSHHKRLHNDNRKKYICDLCKNKEFYNKSNLAHHMKVIHLGILYTCEFCNKTFSSLQGISAHRELKHFNSKKHVCNKCNKSFAIRRHLTTHLKTHDTTRRFQCTKCFQNFKHLKTLKSHLVRKHEKCA